MPAEILIPTDECIARAARVLAKGGVVAMPTETVYGLAGIAFDERALASIFAVKERPTFDPLICHVPERAAGEDWLEHLVSQGLVDARVLTKTASERVRQLAERFWPGPLTMVLPKQPGVPDLATSGLPTVGVRCPRHPVAQRLLAAVGAPLAAPSANRFGRISPTTPQHVMSELGDRIELILDGGPCEIGLESTVILIDSVGEVLFLRPGGIAKEAIEFALDIRIVLSGADDLKVDTPLPSPGLLASHYAPRKPLHTFRREAWPRADAHARLGWLISSGKPPDGLQGARIEVLSPTGDLNEAARRLFGALRSLDEAVEVDEIWAELCPGDAGLAYAINDRLLKARHRP